MRSFRTVQIRHRNTWGNRVTVPGGPHKYVGKFSNPYLLTLRKGEIVRHQVTGPLWTPQKPSTRGPTTYKKKKKNYRHKLVR